MLIQTYVVYDSRLGSYLSFGNKGKLVAWTLHRFYVLKLTHTLLYDAWWYHHSCCQWHKEDLANSWIKYTRWKVMIILGYWTLHHFHTQTLQSLHLTLLRKWLLVDLHWFLGPNMTGKGQTQGSKSCNWWFCLRRIALFTTNTYQSQSYRHDRLDVQDIHPRCIKLTKYIW